MAGVTNPNYAGYLLDGTKVTARSAEVPNADWAGGVNQAGSNACGIGINSGDYDPKPQDWPLIENDAESRHIGDTTVTRIIAVPDGVNDEFEYVQASSDVAPDTEIQPLLFNRTGKTVPNGSWVWGVIARP